MPTPVLNPSNLDDAIALYQSGETIQKCASLCGIGHETFRQRLIARGIPLRGRGWVPDSKKIPTPEGLIEKYLGGSSAKALEAEYGISRRTISRMLSEAGIDPRNRSSAMLVRWRNAGPEERKRMLDAAHDGARGRTVPHESKVSRAQAGAGIPKSPLETEIGGLFLDLGHRVEYAVPLDVYNIDVVVAGTVAVEVFGGNWHEAGHHRALFGERSRHILDAGYSLAIVWVHPSRYPISLRCAQNLASLVEITRSHPSIRRQHWVIRGDGYFLAVREDDGDEVPFVTSSGRRERP